MVTLAVLAFLLSDDIFIFALSTDASSQTRNYHLILENKTWYEAQHYCRQRYTDLVSIRDQQHNEEVMIKGLNSSTPFWIGLLCDDWQWVDGGISAYRNWESNQPLPQDNSEAQYKALCHIRCVSGPEDTFSSERRFGPSPTHRDPGGTRLLMTSDSNFCSDHNAMTQGHFIFYLKKVKPFFLFSVNDAHISSSAPVDLEHVIMWMLKGFELTVKPPFSSEQLIRLHHTLLCDNWQWSDGGISAYRNWERNQPQPQENCAAVRGERWYSVPCSNHQSALCYNNYIHVSEEALSWEKALDYCDKGNRAGLLQIESEHDQTDLENELRRRRVSEPVWVGLRQSQLFGFWIWPDGKAVFPYSNWDEGKQPEHQLSQHCGAVVPQSYSWKDMNCEAQYKALCHIRCSP
ncbi:C-type mannose receptor 2-like [Tachysurus fulvidraco]|uniref:C-type mannose receptor 2-like n=1 Tax=Tachysurus fulvidraco TaxID=1234273 RepID=UPI001FEF8BA0|nr:C-type mannose receptor 2-like [Tachysurus fulvidraco]